VANITYCWLVVCCLPDYDRVCCWNFVYTWI